MMVLTVSVPLRLVSSLNAREHWSKRAKRAAEQRAVTRMRLAGEKRWPPHFPVSVRIVRIGPRQLDGDNLVGAAKHVRDGVADALGVDDGSPLVRWSYGQRKGLPRQYGVEVTVREALK